jgi:polysaccharide export outer membrane protein
MNFMKKYLALLALVAFMSSCLSTKKMTHFQGDPISSKEISKLNNEPYRLQINDVLYIDTKAVNQELVALFSSGQSGTTGNLYYSGYTVDRMGNIRIPYIGELNVLGYTEKEVREKIESELPKYLLKPEEVFVTVKLGGINFIVSGEVGSPGSKSLALNQVSIIDALANSGEITEYGDRSKVLIIRKSLDGVQKYYLDMTDIGIFQSEHFYIQPNDIIYVSPLKQKSWGTGTTGLQTFTTLASMFAFVVSTVLLIKNI